MFELTAPQHLMQTFKRVSLYAVCVCVLRSPLGSPASLILNVVVFSLLL